MRISISFASSIFDNPNNVQQLNMCVVLSHSSSTTCVQWHHQFLQPVIYLLKPLFKHFKSHFPDLIHSFLANRIVAIAVQFTLPFIYNINIYYVESLVAIAASCTQMHVYFINSCVYDSRHSFTSS